MSFLLAAARVFERSIHYCRRRVDNQFDKIEIAEYLPAAAMGLDAVQWEGWNVHNDIAQARRRIERGAPLLLLETSKVGDNSIVAVDLHNRKVTRRGPETEEEHSKDRRKSNDVKGNNLGSDEAAKPDFEGANCIDTAVETELRVVLLDM